MLGWPEIILILVVLVLIFGPAKLPEIARALGEAMREFKKASSELEQAVQALDTPATTAAAGQRAPPAVAVTTPPAEPSTTTAATEAPAQSTSEITAEVPATPPSAGAEGQAYSGLVEVAQKLGISTEGKSEDEIKGEILNRAKSPSKEA